MTRMGTALSSSTDDNHGSVKSATAHTIMHSQLIPFVCVPCVLCTHPSQQWQIQGKLQLRNEYCTTAPNKPEGGQLAFTIFREKARFGADFLAHSAVER
jgi:hypothetical protein